MKEKLIIKNFGPIKSVELEIGRFTVLIGEQATGKSTVAKVLASIYSLLESKGGGSSGVMKKSDLESLSHFRNHLSVYEIDDYLKSDSIIQLSGKDIKFYLGSGIINFSYKDVNFYLESENILFNYDELIRQSYFVTNSITYIPAERIATALFSGSTWADLIDVEEGRIDMPKSFLRFYSLFNRLKKARYEYDFTDILGVKFRQDNGIDKIILKDGATISISESASAIQSNLSLFTIIDWQSEKRDENVHKVFIIEEPELNLFPATQNKLMCYLVDKTFNYGNNMLLTTHSPYVLTSLNNLIYAYKVGQEHSEETTKIIDKKYWLNQEDVSVYMMLPDGTYEDIMDREEGLIKAEKIDAVSGILNEEFDNLLTIEFAKNELHT